MKDKATQLLLTGRIGDGHLYIDRKNKDASAKFFGIIEDYIKFKHDILTDYGIICSDVKGYVNKGAYKTDKLIYGLYVHTNPKITEVYKMDRLDVIKNLDYFGFLIYFLDDGSFHKKVKGANLYCNSFNAEEIEALREKIFELFPVKYSSVCVDRRKNGKCYPYLYIHKATTEAITNYYYQYMVDTNELHKLTYKLGFTV